MTSIRLVHRWGALSGVGGFALLFVALFLPGAPPRADASVAELSATLVDHRVAFVRGTVLAGIAVVLLLWFVAEVATSVRRIDPTAGPAAIAAVLGGSIGLTFMFVGMLLFSGVAFKAAAVGDPAAVRTAVDTGNMVVESSKLGFALLILAACSPMGGHPLLPVSMRRTGRVVAVVMVASSVPPYLVDGGLGQFGGVIDVLGGLPAFAWLLALSVHLARSGPAS